MAYLYMGPVLLCCCVTAILTHIVGLYYLLAVSAVIGVLTWVWTQRQNRRTVPTAGKAVVVTGCDTGIGHCLALYLAQRGVRVYAGCLDPEGPGATKLLQNDLDTLHVVTLDVTKQDVIERCLERVKQDVGDSGVWGVVNNAGVAVEGDLELNTLQQISHLLDVNLMGVIRVTKAFLPLLRNSKGRLVNVTSIKGLLAMPLNAAYCASKFGVEALSDVLRQELSRFGVRVSIIEPSNFGGATSIIDDDKIQRDFDEMWTRTDEKTRDVYGRDYIDAILKMLRDSRPVGCFDLSRVAQDVNHALFAERPWPRYLVAGGQNTIDELKVRVLLNPFLPEWVLDKIQMDELGQLAMPKCLQGKRNM